MDDSPAKKEYSTLLERAFLAAYFEERIHISKGVEETAF